MLVSRFDVGQRDRGLWSEILDLRFPPKPNIRGRILHGPCRPGCEGALGRAIIELSSDGRQTKNQSAYNAKTGAGGEEDASYTFIIRYSRTR